MSDELWRSERQGSADGADSVVVLVHGSMDRSAAFARVVGGLADVTTVRYDRRGYGRSVGAGVTDLEGHAADCLAVLGDRTGVLVGHSLGGVIALMAAQRSDDVRAVGAYEAPMSWQRWWPASSAGGAALGGLSDEDAAERFMRRMIGDERWAALPAGTRAARRAEGPALVTELRSLRERPAYDLARIAVPILPARGTETASHHRRAAEELARFTGREAFVIEGAGHGAHVSHAAAFATFERQVLAAAR